MAQKVRIVGGPSRWNFLLSALYEGKAQRFKISPSIPELDEDTGGGKLTVLNIRVLAVGRYAGVEHPDLSVGTTETWVFEGAVASSEPHTDRVGGCWARVRGEYDTALRNGSLTLIEML